MQSLDYKLETSNTNYVTARRNVQYFPSLLSSRHLQPRLLRPARPDLCQRPALRRHQLLRPHRGVARSAEGREYNQNKAVEG